MSLGKLSLCATPIGNLGDVTLRVLETLKQADTICAEDTRITSRLLAAYEINKRIERLDEVTLSKQLTRIVERLLDGEHIAYCTDAGMPGVSDPGLRLVDAAHNAEIFVEVLPGASAAITAYVSSGTESPHFYFGGFLPKKANERVSALDALKNLDAALVFYESPNRLLASLEALVTAFPSRQMSVCRELTKLHEEIKRDLPHKLYSFFLEKARTSSIKGEIVIVIDPPSTEENTLRQYQNKAAAYERALTLRAEGTHTTKGIVSALRAEFDISRNLAYELATQVKETEA